MTPMNYTLHGILQARILEWVAVVFSTGSSRPRNRSQVSCMEGGFFTSWATSEVWDLLWIFTNITSWGGKGENRTNTSTYLHRFTNYLHKFMNQENEPIWIMQIWKLTTTKSSGNNCGLEKNNGGSHGKQFACNAGDSGLISGSGRFPGQGNGNSLQYSGLENSMDRAAWQVRVHSVANSPTGLSDWHYRKQSTAQKTITPATETWDHEERILLFPGGSLSESRSVVSNQKLSGSSVHGIHQARILQWVTILFLGESSPGTEPGSTSLKTGCLSHLLLLLSRCSRVQLRATP